FDLRHQSETMIPAVPALSPLVRHRFGFVLARKSEAQFATEPKGAGGTLGVVNPVGGLPGARPQDGNRFFHSHRVALVPRPTRAGADQANRRIRLVQHVGAIVRGLEITLLTVMAKDKYF